jgi:hypothetical protein
MAFIHVIAYRILIFTALIAGVLTMYSLYSPTNYATAILAKAFLAISWLLFTPQLLQAGKAFVVMRTRGVVFGSLNKSFVDSEIGKSSSNSASFILYRIFPYAAIVVWLIGFVVLVFVWYV